MTDTRTVEESMTVDGCGLGERLVIWAVRTWFSGFQSGTDMREAMKRDLAVQDLDRIVEPVDRLMTILSLACIRKARINCHCCQEVTAAELSLLKLVAAAQNDADLAAAVREAELCHERAVFLFTQALTDLASALTHSGIPLRRVIPAKTSVAPAGVSQRMH